MRSTITYDMLQEYILDNNLTENDTITLHPDDYDTVASEFVSEHDLIIFRPVEILGVRVTEDTGGEVKRNHIFIVPLAAS